MEHARKMVIVPPELIQRLKSASDTQNSVLSQLDSEMRLILERDLSDHDKWNEYNQVLQKYLHFSDEMRKPVNMPIEEQYESTNFRLSSTDIIDTLPVTYRKKGETFMRTLAGLGDVSWDENGRVSIKGDVVPASNIIDLVHDMIRPRKNTNPAGWQSLAVYLKNINFPQELIGNVNRRSSSIGTPMAKTKQNIKESGNFEDASKMVSVKTPGTRVDKQEKKPEPTSRILDWESFKL